MLVGLCSELWVISSPEFCLCQCLNGKREILKLVEDPLLLRKPLVSQQLHSKICAT